MNNKHKYEDDPEAWFLVLMNELGEQRKLDTRITIGGIGIIIFILISFLIVSSILMGT